MKIEFNVKRSHIIIIIALLVIVGFGIAQTPPNPGHVASQVNIGGSVNNNLETWANSANGRISTIETSYCQQSGTNCPAQTLPSGIVYSIANNQQCPPGTTGWICIKYPGNIQSFSQFNSHQAYWSGTVWRSSTSGSSTCDRVICA